MPSPQEEILRARIDLDFIVQLENSPAFNRYFLRRLSEKISAIEARILDDNFPVADIPRDRAILSTLRDVSRMCRDDAAGCHSLLGDD